MVWRRKGTRYAWGRQVEQQLRNIGRDDLQLVSVRSAQSQSILDIIWLGRHVYCFQTKRTDAAQGFGSVRGLLRVMCQRVTATDAVRIVAVYHRRKHGRRGKHLHWRIFMTEGDYQKLRRWADVLENQ